MLAVSNVTSESEPKSNHFPSLTYTLHYVTFCNMNIPLFVSLHIQHSYCFSKWYCWYVGNLFLALDKDDFLNELVMCLEFFIWTSFIRKCKFKPGLIKDKCIDSTSMTVLWKNVIVWWDPPNCWPPIIVTLQNSDPKIF